MPPRRVPSALPPRIVLLPLILLLALTGCAAVLGTGEERGVDPSAHPDVTAADGAVRLVAVERADLVLHVSNQSFEDGRVRLTVAVDGTTVVDGEFLVEDQHNWVTFPLRVPPGDHVLVARSDSGARLREPFRIPARGTRYAVVDHWTEDGSAELTWLFRRQPVAFA